MDSENSFQLDNAGQDGEHMNISLETINGKDTAEDSTKDKDGDISIFDDTVDINIAMHDTSSDKGCSTTYEKLKAERQSEDKIYDQLKKRRILKFQLPAKKYLYFFIAVTGIVVVILILVMTLAIRKKEGNINLFLLFLYLLFRLICIALEMSFSLIINRADVMWKL